MADTLFLFLAMAAVTVALVVAAPVLAGLPRGRAAARRRPRPSSPPACRCSPCSRCTLIIVAAGVAGGRCSAGPGRLRRRVRRAGARLRGLVQVRARRVRDDRLHRGLPVLAGDDVRRLLPDVAAGRPAAAVHVGAARPAADRAGLHLDAGQPARPVPRADVLPHGRTSWPSGSPSRPSRRSRSTTRARSGTTRSGPSTGTARSSPTGRPTTRTCSARSRSPYLDGLTGATPSTEAYYARGNPQTVVVNPFAAVIRDYQRYVWLPGTVYGLILLVGLAGIVRRWRRAARPRCCRGCARSR